MELALGAPRYTPRPSSTPLKTIIEDALDELQRVYDDRFRSRYGPLAPRTTQLFERYLLCGDPHFGFLRLRCGACGHDAILPFSCKARGLCPSCGKRRAIELAERLATEVLPSVPYAPLVFTIPKLLRPAFLFHRPLYGIFCQVAYRVIREHLEARFPTIEAPIPAFVASAQSFGNLLNFHPHIHAVASLGVFDEEGRFHEDLDIDFEEAETAFRDIFLETLERKGFIDDCRVALIRSWPHSGFRLHAEPPIPGGNRFELESLLRYMERPPVSLERLTHLDTGMVHYRGKFHPGLGRDHQLVTTVEFLAMLVPHIQLRHEIRLRLYGAVSTTKRKQFGWIEAERVPEEAAPAVTGTLADDGDSDFTLARRRGWARLIQKVWLDDPTLCPKCGGTMKIIAALCSPHQDDTIEAILRARDMWSPPWIRAGPRSGAKRRSSGERVIEYDIDPALLWPDD